MILAIDQGTTGTTCIVFDEEGQVAGRAYSEFEQHFPRPGWVEHDAARDLGRHPRAWRRRRSTTPARAELQGIGITNQRETVVAWDRDSGEPLHRALVWQDRRTSARCDELREDGSEDLFRERTGLVIDPYFSGTKIEWLLQNGVARERRVRDDRLLARLQAHRAATRPTTRTRRARCSSTSTSSRWDEELCDLLGVNRGLAARAAAERARVRRDRASSAAACPWPGSRATSRRRSTGRPATSQGVAKNTYGTGSFLLQNAGSEPPPLERGVLNTVAWGVGDRVDYAVEASIFVTGAAVQWLRDGLGIIDEAAETEGLARLARHRTTASTSCRRSPASARRTGTRTRAARSWASRAATAARTSRARRSSRSPTRRRDAARVIEEASGVELEELKADGGASENGWLMQFQADILGVPVVVPEIVARPPRSGAAYLAGVAVEAVDRGGDARDVARGGALRAGDGARTSASGSARRLGRARSSARAPGHENDG